MAEHDNAGFPLPYCLLTTADAIDIGKRKKALEEWVVMLRDRYGVYPWFAHLNKDMAEIGMVRTMWEETKIQLCFWHLKDAIKRRLAQPKLTTAPYNGDSAHASFSFIDPKFKPPGRSDKTEYEGGKLPSEQPVMTSAVLPVADTRPWVLKIRVPGVNAREPALHDTPASTHTSENPGPVMSQPTEEGDDEEGDEDEREKEGSPCRVFCPNEHRSAILQLIQTAFCAHPLIPGYAASDRRRYTNGRLMPCMFSAVTMIFRRSGRIYGRIGCELVDGSSGHDQRTKRSLFSKRQ